MEQITGWQAMEVGLGQWSENGCVFTLAPIPSVHTDLYEIPALVEAALDFLTV